MHWHEVDATCGFLELGGGLQLMLTPCGPCVAWWMLPNGRTVGIEAGQA